MRASKLIVAALAAMLLTQPANAQFLCWWENNNPNAAAVLDDPLLMHMQSWRLMVHTDGNWLSASLNLTLPAGQTFYRAPGASIIFNPSGTPAQRYTTSVFSPPDQLGNSSVIVLGGFPSGPVSDGSSSSVSPGTFSASWGDLITSAAGTYMVDVSAMDQPKFGRLLSRSDTRAVANVGAERLWSAGDDSDWRLGSGTGFARPGPHIRRAVPAPFACPERGS